MPPDSAGAAAEEFPALPGDLVLVRRLRGSARSGCGQARRHDGSLVFVRWDEPGSGVPQPDAEMSAPEREYRALTSIACAGVPRPLDLVRSAGGIASVTSWLDGVALGSDHAARIEAITASLTAVLDRAHWFRWVHGDIKPENVVVDVAGGVHLVDWAGARKIGDPAPPGTLGYAPPWAWAANYSAQPCNDVYSLAVTLWEIWSGRRAFTGDRADVLARQGAFDFPDAERAPESLRRLVECARRGAEGSAAGANLGGVAERVRGARTEEVARRILRPEAVTAAQAALRAPAEGPVRVTVEVPAADLDSLAGSMADLVRLERRRNCVRWSEIVAWGRDPAEQGVPDAATSRVDGLRDRRSRARAAAARRVRSLAPVVVIATVGEIEGPAHGAWEQFCADVGTGEPGVLTAVVESNAARSPGARAPADRSREVAESLLCTTSVAERLVGVISRHAKGSVTHAIDEIAAYATADSIRERSGTLDFAGTAAPRTSDAVRLPRAAAPGPEVSIEAVLDRGEAAAVDGDIHEVVRSCIRVHSSLGESGAPDLGVVLRLADLWMECGRSDAAEAVLRTVPLDAMSADCILRLAKVLVTRGDPGAAEPVLALLPARATSRRHTAEAQRLRAIALLNRREFAAAFQVLRQELKEREALPELAQLWLWNTAGNALRMLGRQHSACRVLRYVKQRATQSGSVRIQIAASGNLLLAQSDEVSPARRAAESWEIARRCIDLGMMPDGLMWARAAAIMSIAAGESAQARDALGVLLRADRVVQVGYSDLIGRLRWLHFSAIDIDEEWKALGVVPEVTSSTTSGDMLTLHLALLRLEVGRNPSVHEQFEFSEPCERARPHRCLRVARRLVSRRCVSSKRLIVALREASVAFDGCLPIMGHACRVTVRTAREGATLAELLRSARLAATQFDSVANLALSVHVLALAWCHDVDAESLRWLAENAVGDERRRPAGVRLWEWRLACLRAAALSGEPTEQQIDGVIVAMESTIDRLWEGAAATYVPSLPLGIVAGLAGLDPSAEPYRERNLESPIRLERLRAALYRQWIAKGQIGGRAASLERVLESALRLRSAVEVDSLLGEIVKGVISICRAERAVVVYAKGRTQSRAKVATAEGVREMPPADAEVSLTAVKRVRDSGRACLFDDACGDGDLGGRPSVMRFRPRSLIVAPLQTQGDYLGYLYVENRSAAKSFSEGDVEVIEGFAAQAALALENAQLVSELRKSCEELDRARNDAVRAESLRAVGRMTSEVAHDFNNLLTAILGETQLLMRDPAAAAHLRSLGVVERAALDAAEVIRRIQSTTRARDSRTFEVVSIADIVSRVLDMLRWRVTAARVEVACRVPADLHVRGVASELREVFTNVIVNALEAMSDGGKLRIEGRGDGDQAVVSVEDTGCGMPPEVLSKLFEPFFTTKGERGNGLGLAIAHGIVQRHGGDIRVTSEPGRGTRIAFVLPAAVPGTLPTTPVRSEADEPQSARPTGRDALNVLVVDDEPSVARVLASMLQAIGAATEVSIGGNAAIDRITRGDNRYDVVITDVNMPDRNGIDVARTTLAEAAGTRVIVMSGSLGGREEETAHALGVSVLRKPFTIGDVRRVLDRA